MNKIPIIGESDPEEKELDASQKKLMLFYYALGQRDSAFELFRYMKKHGMHQAIEELVKGMLKADATQTDALYVQENFDKIANPLLWIEPS